MRTLTDAQREMVLEAIAGRDALIVDIMEALQEEMTAEPVNHFLNAAAIADVLIARYTLRRTAVAGAETPG